MSGETFGVDRSRGSRGYATATTARLRRDGTFAATLRRPSRGAMVRTSFAGDGAARPAVSRPLSLRAS